MWDPPNHGVRGYLTPLTLISWPHLKKKKKIIHRILECTIYIYFSSPSIFPIIYFMYNFFFLSITEIFLAYFNKV